MTLVRTYDAATAERSALWHLGSLVRFPQLVWTNRYMVQNFLRRDLMARVNGSALGVGWILLQPLFLFALYFLVFGIFLGSRVPGQGPDVGFALYLFSGLIVFHAISEATTMSCTLIVDNGNLVKKVSFPSEVLLVHLGLSAGVTYLVGAVVVLVAGLSLGELQVGWLLVTVPLLLLIQYVLVLGMGMLLANLHVFLRDTAQLWRLVTMAWMFTSPVFLRVDGDAGLVKMVGENTVSWMQMLNPAWSLIQAHRLALGVVPESAVDVFWTHVAVAAAWAFGFLLVGYGLFMSRKHKYSDLI